MEKDVLFLSGLFPKEKEKEILKYSKTEIQSAANALQWNIVKGLDLNLGKPVKILNSVYVGTFPFRYKKLLLKSYKFNHSLSFNKHEDFNIGFINLTGIRVFLKLILLKFRAKKWALDGEKNKIIIAYSLRSNNLKIFKYLKNLNSQIKTCVIVDDLPQYVNTSNVKSIYSLLREVIETKNLNKFLRYSDSFVLLTEKMKEKLDVGNKPYIVMEGISSSKDEEFYYTENDNYNNDIKTILYTGTLNEKYGVINLINAFKNIDKVNYRLVICGDGDSKDKILKASSEDSRIIFNGVVPREKILELQSKVTVLINPRQNSYEFCKYSFPSKLLEYLSSGVPTIAYKLSGVPNEYDKYINYIEENSEEALKNKIIEVCECEYYEKKKLAEEARIFVRNNKNPKVQCEKILKMMTNIKNEHEN